MLGNTQDILGGCHKGDARRFRIRSSKRTSVDRSWELMGGMEHCYVGYVVELEVIKPVNAQIGVVGPQGSALGGANQLNFLFQPRGGAEFFKVTLARELP